MTKLTLYLDLDGVMADFDAHFPATFGLDHRGLGAVSCSEIDARTKENCIAKGGSVIHSRNDVQCIMGGRGDH